MNAVGYLTVVCFLGCTVLFCVGGIIYLDSLGKEIPPSLSGVCGAAMGALVGLLGQPPKITREVKDGERTGS